VTFNFTGAAMSGRGRSVEEWAIAWRKRNRLRVARSGCRKAADEAPPEVWIMKIAADPIHNLASGSSIIAKLAFLNSNEGATNILSTYRMISGPRIEPTCHDA